MSEESPADNAEGFFDGLWDGVKDLLSAVAPTLATALFGPFGGVAVSVLTKAVGLPAGAPQDQVVAALKGADPATLLAIKQCETQFIRDMKALDVDVLKVEGEDRANARAREIAVRDKTPAILAYLITAGFFVVLLYSLTFGVPENGRDALLILLGGLSTAWLGCLGYYFGSTHGSQTKTNAIIAGLTPKK